jgi:hypothetical protein
MRTYDADVGPPAAEWLATAEADRIRIVEAYHRRQRIKLPRPTLHATIHVVVENQIAIGEDVVIDAMARLQREGLSRHESLHAVGMILTEQLYGLLKGNIAPGSDPNSRYRERVQHLSADDWRNSGNDEQAG